MHGTSILASVSTDLSRYADVLALLTSLPQRVPALQVVVVNGSAVTGGWDEHSDLDVGAWCDSDASATYDAVLALVRAELPVDHVWELPAATWPDMRQSFIHLQPVAADLSRPTRLIDLVLRKTPERLTMDTRRHGTPMVLHDPGGLLVLEDDDEHEMEAARREAVEQAGARRQTAAWLVACWQAAHPGEPLGRTLRWRHRADSLPYHCDGLFVPVGWLPALRDCTILTGGPWDIASDHHPVVATFDWRGLRPPGA